MAEPTTNRAESDARINYPEVRRRKTKSVASEEKTRSGLISDWLAHGVGISDELREHGGCRFASAENFTETNVNNVNNSFTNKNNNPPAATSFAQPNGGEAASHDNLFLLVNGRRPLGVLFIFVSVYILSSSHCISSWRRTSMPLPARPWRMASASVSPRW